MEEDLGEFGLIPQNENPIDLPPPEDNVEDNHAEDDVVIQEVQAINDEKKGRTRDQTRRLLKDARIAAGQFDIAPKHKKPKEKDEQLSEQQKKENEIRKGCLSLAFFPDYKKLFNGYDTTAIVLWLASFLTARQVESTDATTGVKTKQMKFTCSICSNHDFVFRDAQSIEEHCTSSKHIINLCTQHKNLLRINLGERGVDVDNDVKINAYAKGVVECAGKLWVLFGSGKLPENLLREVLDAIHHIPANQGITMPFIKHQGNKIQKFCDKAMIGKSEKDKFQVYVGDSATSVVRGSTKHHHAAKLNDVPLPIQVADSGKGDGGGADGLDEALVISHHISGYIVGGDVTNPRTNLDAVRHAAGIRTDAGSNMCVAYAILSTPRDERVKKFPKYAKSRRAALEGLPYYPHLVHMVCMGHGLNNWVKSAPFSNLHKFLAAMKPIIKSQKYNTVWQLSLRRVFGKEIGGRKFVKLSSHSWRYYFALGNWMSQKHLPVADGPMDSSGLPLHPTELTRDRSFKTIRLPWLTTILGKAKDQGRESISRMKLFYELMRTVSQWQTISVRKKRGEKVRDGALEHDEDGHVVNPEALVNDSDTDDEGGEGGGFDEVGPIGSRGKWSDLHALYTGDEGKKLFEAAEREAECFALLGGVDKLEALEDGDEERPLEKSAGVVYASKVLQKVGDPNASRDEDKFPVLYQHETMRNVRAHVDRCITDSQGEKKKWFTEVLSTFDKRFDPEADHTKGRHQQTLRTAKLLKIFEIFRPEKRLKTLIWFKKKVMWKDLATADEARQTLMRDWFKWIGDDYKSIRESFCRFFGFGTTGADDREVNEIPKSLSLFLDENHEKWGDAVKDYIKPSADFIAWCNSFLVYMVASSADLEQVFSGMKAIVDYASSRYDDAAVAYLTRWRAVLRTWKPDELYRSAIRGHANKKDTAVRGALAAVQRAADTQDNVAVPQAPNLVAKRKSARKGTRGGDCGKNKRGNVPNQEATEEIQEERQEPNPPDAVNQANQLRLVAGVKMRSDDENRTAWKNELMTVQVTLKGKRRKLGKLSSSGETAGKRGREDEEVSRLEEEIVDLEKQKSILERKIKKITLHVQVDEDIQIEDSDSDLGVFEEVVEVPGPGLQQATSSTTTAGGGGGASSAPQVGLSPRDLAVVTDRNIVGFSSGPDEGGAWRIPHTAELPTRKEMWNSINFAFLKRHPPDQEAKEAGQNAAVQFLQLPVHDQFFIMRNHQNWNVDALDLEEDLLTTEGYMAQELFKELQKEARFWAMWLIAWRFVVFKDEDMNFEWDASRFID